MSQRLPADSGREVGRQTKRECGQKQNRSKAVRDEVAGTLVRWYTGRHGSQSDTVESGDGQGQGAARVTRLQS